MRAQNRATALAMQGVKATRHSMVLEDQIVGEEDEREHVNKLAKQLAAQPGSKLWRDQ